MAVNAETLLRTQLAGLPANHPDRAIMQAGIDVFAAYNANKQASVEVPQIESLSGEALQAELEAQAQRYIDFGFAKKLKITPGLLKDSIMNLTVPQPEVYRGRFDIPAVVIGSQIPAKDQYRMIGLNYYLDNLRVQNMGDTQDRLHLVWMQDGRKNLGKSVDLVRAGYATDERGANLYDGAGLLIARPRVLEDHFVDLPGAQVGSDGTAYLYTWDVGPEVRYHFTDNADSKFGSASCGK